LEFLLEPVRRSMEAGHMLTAAYIVSLYW